MKNETKIKISKKLAEKLEIVYKDYDGYWAETKAGYRFSGNESHTATEDTVNALKSHFKDIVKCDCEECANQ